MLHKNIFIVDAARTPIGKFLGQFQDMEAPELGAAVIRSILDRNAISEKNINKIIVGQVLTAGVGMNPARQTALFSNLPEQTSCYTVNQVCGSGLRAVINACLDMFVEENQLILAGGQENMTRARHTILSRIPTKLGDIKLLDTLYKDGLMDCFNNCTMGLTAENVVKKYKISREEQDTFALESQQKYQRAYEKDLFQSEIIDDTYFQNKKITNYIDEHPKPEVTLEKLGSLNPVFEKEGTVTPGNASGINDGAAFVLLADEKAIQTHQLKPIARIMGWADEGLDPKFMGLGPVFAVRKLLKSLNMKIEDFDLIENNEAFAATSIAVEKELNLKREITNVNGGSIALGHPIGASGTRILGTLVHEMQRRKAKNGLATMCIGGGMGIAVAIEKI